MGATALVIATSTEAFSLRAHALLHATVVRRAHAARGAPGSRHSLALALPRAALLHAAASERASSCGASSAAVETALQGDIDAAIAAEVDAAASCLRFVTVLDWFAVQRVLVALESVLEAQESHSNPTGAAYESPMPQRPLLPALSYAANLRVVVLDSLASIVVPLLGPHPLGHAAMMEAGARLRRVARNHRIAAIVTNSVTVERDHASAEQHILNAAGHLPLRPSLGPSWLCVPDVSLLVTMQYPAALVFAKLKTARAFV